MFETNSKILVVDDMRAMRRLVKTSLEALGYKDIEEAENGKEAWQKLLEHDAKFDLIISDWNMPVCDGLKFLRMVRAEDATKKIPFMMLTAESEVKEVSKAIAAGVNNYIVKPVSTEIIRQKMEQTYKIVTKKAG